jgi:tRNA modification GTPase
VVLQWLLRRCLELGARQARPGEFSERAFLNGKMDLTQAEAVADLIASGSQAQARAAIRSLDGDFARAVHRLLDALVGLRVYVEAALDFPEEEIDFLGDARVQQQLHTLRTELDRLLELTRRGQRVQEGLHVVIAGAPNAGKSSLLNALAGSERAIVTAIPGTTRDLLREAVTLDGIELTLVDTAGLRETADLIEAEGVRRAQRELERADVVLWLCDATDPTAPAAPAAHATERCVVLHTKSDLAGESARRELIQSQCHLWLSARTGAGLELLRDELSRRAGVDEAGSGAFSARARHVDALRRVGTNLDRGTAALLDNGAGELLAEELRQAQQALGEITGVYTSDDLLGAIFSSFCIGK